MKKFSLIIGATIIPNIVFAAGYQIFPYLSYENPASLTSVNKAEIIGGILIPSVKFEFNGNNGPLIGTAISHETDYQPYGRVAWRINKKWIAGVDITHPMYVDIQFPSDSIVSTVARNTILIDTNYSPKLCFEIKKGLSIGAGFDANYLSHGEISFVVPPFGLVSNSGDDWAYGWDAGISYAASKTTIIGLSYYSKITHDIKGDSHWGPFSTNNVRLNAINPATYTLNILQLLTEKWALNAIVRYVDWQPLQVVDIKNSALPFNNGLISIPLHYKNSWTALLATRYQLNDKWAVKAAFDYHSNQEPLKYRPIGLPADQICFGLAGFEYAINKCWTTQLLYIHGFADPKIETSGPLGPINGRVAVNVNVIDFNISWHI